MNQENLGPRKPVLRKQAEIKPVGEDRLLVGWGGRHFVIGTPAPHAIERLLRSCDGRKTVAEIVTAHRERIRPDVVRGTLRRTLDAGILLDVSRPDRAVPAHELPAALEDLSPHLRNLEGGRRLLVLVFGPTGLSLLHALAAWVPAAWKTVGTRAGALDNGGLPRRRFRRRFRFARDGRGRERMARELADADLAVAFLEGCPWGTAEDLGAMAVRTRTSLLLAHVEGDVLHLGPSVRAGTPGCRTCFRLRYFGSLIALQGMEDAVAESVLGTPTFEPHARVAAGLLASETLTALLDPEAARSFGNWVRVRMSTAERETAELIPFGPCPVCGTEPRPTRSRRVPAGVPLRVQSRAKLHGENGSRYVRPEETLQRTRRLVSPVGIIHEVRGAHHTDVLGLPVTFARVSHPPGSEGALVQWGKGITPTQSRVSAIMEGIERQSAQFHGDERFLSAHLAGARRIAGRALAPDEILSALPGHFPTCGLDRGFRPDRPADWTWATSLLRAEPLLVPSNLVYTTYPRPPARRFYRPTTNGLAAGNCLEEAILQGALELVERDAVYILMQNRICAPDVIPDRVRYAPIAALLERIRSTGLDLILKDFTTDLGIPVVVSCIRSRHDKPAFAFGMGCHLDPEVALSRAVTEAALCRANFKYCSELPMVRKDSENWRAIEDAEAYPIYHELTAPGPCARKLGEMQTSGSSSDILDDIRTVMARIEATLPDPDLIVVDLTRPAYRVPVVRVFVPGLQEVCVNPQVYFPVTERMYELPRRLGYTRRPTRWDDLYKGPFMH